MDNELLYQWLVEYGSMALFFLLALEIIALPIPGEPLMVITGVLLSTDDLALFPTLIAAYCGACLGISISFLLGKTAGSYLVTNYGPRIGITDARMQRVNTWFNRFGKWTLMIGYFVPGIRHFTGFTAGITSLEYRQFMLFAYVGAFIWVTTFLSLGYFFGDYWLLMVDKIIDFFRNLIA